MQITARGIGRGTGRLCVPRTVTGGRESLQQQRFESRSTTVRSPVHSLAPTHPRPHLHPQTKTSESQNERTWSRRARYALRCHGLVQQSLPSDPTDRSYRSALPLLPGQFLTDQTGYHRQTCGTLEVENPASDSFAHDRAPTTRNPRCASTWPRRGVSIHLCA